jgi:hypothetical protein
MLQSPGFIRYSPSQICLIASAAAAHASSGAERAFVSNWSSIGNSARALAALPNQSANAAMVNDAANKDQLQQLEKGHCMFCFDSKNSMESKIIKVGEKYSQV